MSNINSLSLSVPGSVKPGELYRLPDTQRYVIPEVEARRVGMTDEQRSTADREQRFGEVAAWSSAGEAFATLHDGLKKIDRILSIVSPELPTNKWDFTLSDGKLVANGDLTDEQKNLVEGFLNAMPGMTEAAQALEDAAVSFLDVNGSGSMPAYKVNGYTNKYAMSYYKDVAGQLDGKLNLRDLISETEKFATNNGRSHFSGGPVAVLWGQKATEVIESHLEASDPVFDPPTQPAR
jgi:hypothetical protein